MLRESSFLWRNLFVLADLTLSAAIFMACFWLRFVPPISWWFPPQSPKPLVEVYIAALPALCITFLITNAFFRLYHPRRISSFFEEFVAILQSNLMAMLLLTSYFFLYRGASYARGIALLFLLLNPAGLFLFRLFVRTLLRWLRSQGFNLRHVLIVGTGRQAQALLHRIRRNRWTGLRIAGLVSLGASKIGSRIHGLPILGAARDIETLISKNKIDQIFVALPPEKREETTALLAKLADRMIPVRLVQDRFLELQHPITTDFDGLRIVQLWENRLTGWNAFAKRALDCSVAALGTVILAPLLLLIALLIRLTSRGPIFYTQERMGHDGRTFSIIKFRSMLSGSDEPVGFTQPDDERCTTIGRFLRRTSLDELPQLFNVLAGDMSLVGPRPERPVYIDRFRKTMPRYMLRHRIKAGMTGWAQVNGWRGNSSLKKRLQYDLFYLQNWSLWFDIKILVLTMFRGWMHPNAY